MSRRNNRAAAPAQGAAARDITAWVQAGGPGLADPPDILDLYAFNPSRRIRRQLDT